ncbi:MAG TPA: efflux RND transporter periplasmic adaptor subunit [Coxiellaceae bacterium]|nr:efflux RND transporter periplasmic adaptor subunit [Coxiellaceae bacterium]
MKKVMGFLILLGLVIAAYMHWHPSQKKSLAEPTVTVAYGDITKKAIAVGQIVPKHVTTVKSPIAGITDMWYHDAGDYVKVGEPLLRIRPAPTPQQYAETLTQKKRDTIALKADEQKLADEAYLVKQHVLPSNSVDYRNAQQEYETTKAQLELDQQKLALLYKGQTTIGNQTMQNVIKSPIEGYILQRNVDVGDPVISISDAQSATQLFIIANMQDMIFRGTVDEVDADEIQMGMPADIHVAAIPDKTITGVITKIALQSDNMNPSNAASNNTSSSNNTPAPFNVGFQIEIGQLKVPADTVLRSGFSATAEVVLKTVKHVVVIPERVLIYKDDKPFVRKKVNGKVTDQAVQLGLSDGMNVQVLSGVKVDDVLVEPKPLTGE